MTEETIKQVEEAYINKQFAGKIGTKDSILVRAYRFELQDILSHKANDRWKLNKFITNLKDKVTKLEDKERNLLGYGQIDRSRL